MDAVVSCHNILPGKDKLAQEVAVTKKSPARQAHYAGPRGDRIEVRQVRDTNFAER
jgi:hypothetical protein